MDVDEPGCVVIGEACVRIGWLDHNHGGGVSREVVLARLSTDTLAGVLENLERHMTRDLQLAEEGLQGLLDSGECHSWLTPALHANNGLGSHAPLNPSTLHFVHDGRCSSIHLMGPLHGVVYLGGQDSS